MRAVKYVVAALMLVLVIAAIALMRPAESLQPGNVDDEVVVIDPKDADDDSLKADGPGIQVTEPDNNDEVGLPMVITGYARAFEDTFAYRIKDADGTVLVERHAMAGAPDSGQFGHFTLSVNYPEPAGDHGTLEVFEYSAKDGSEINKVVVPVRFREVDSQVVKAYFQDSKQDPEGLNCSLVFPVERRVPKTQAVARAAVLELLSGLTDSESRAGYFTGINSGVTLKSLNIANGTATVRFDPVFEAGMAGSCKVAMVRAQIEQTLMQFPTVQRVIIEVEGMPTEEVLQP